VLDAIDLTLNRDGDSPRMTIRTDRNVVPPEPTIAELEQKAAECDTQANGESEPNATELREKAKLYRNWIALLRSGRWTSIHDGR
jgi:hypothetical protein